MIQTRMTIEDMIHQRLNNQHLTCPDFAAPAGVVRWFGAVQAQEFPVSLYAIGLRMPAAAEPAVERAIADRSIVRTWPMRGTIHYVPPEDARWMLKLLARRQNARYRGMHRKAGLTDEVIARAGDVLARVLEGGKQLERRRIYALLNEAGIDTGEQRGLHLMVYWAQEGLICFGPRQGKQPSFTLLEEWVPNPTLLEGEEALAVLARRYFASHGPATEYDFAWWTGLTMKEARLGLNLVEPDLEQTTLDGRTYWSASDAPAAPPPGREAYLLPPFDEFTVAYKDRSAFLIPTFTLEEQQHGIGPSIFLGGKFVGTWWRGLQKDSILLKFNLFAPLSKAGQAALVEAAEHYGRFLGLPVVIDGWPDVHSG